MDFSFHNKNECPFHFPDFFFPNPIQWNWSWKFGYFLKNFWRPFWAYLWLESKTMVFVRSSKVTNGWLVTIHDPESFIVTLQGYALQCYNGFLGVIHGYQFHWSLSRTLQMVHFNHHHPFQSKAGVPRNNSEGPEPPILPIFPLRLPRFHFGNKNSQSLQVRESFDF